jgi:hypothetical protein
LIKLRPEQTQPVVHQGVLCDLCNQTIVGIRFKCVTCNDFDLCEKCEGLRTHPAEHPMVMLRTPTDLPAKLAPLMAEKSECKEAAVAKPTGQCPWVAAHSARFCDDVTIRDGSVVTAGAKLVKSWNVVNSGAAPWPASTRLVFLKGHQELLASAAQREFDVVPAAVAPQTIAMLTVELQAPAAPGRYTAHFQMADGAKHFGPQLWIDVEVAPKAVAPTPVVTPVREPQSGRADSEWVSVTPPVSQPSSPPLPAAKSPVVAVTTPPTLDNANLIASLPKKTTEEVKAAAEVPKPVSVPVAAPVTPKPTAATPAPVAASQPVLPPKPSKFASQLNALAAMGFNNRELNEHLLEKESGNLERVCNWLLEHSPK